MTADGGAAAVSLLLDLPEQQGAPMRRATRGALAYWFEPLPVEPRGLEHRPDGGEDAQVGLDDEADNAFGRLLRRWEALASEALLLTRDEIDSVEEAHSRSDGDRDPVGNLVRNAAAMLGRRSSDGRRAPGR